MRIVFFGDSNTWGYNPKTGHRYEHRFTKLVQKAFPQYEIIEEGLNGRTLCQIDPYDLDRIGIRSIQMICKSQLPIDLLVIMLGTNDAKRMFNTNIYSLDKGYRSLLYKIRDDQIYKDGFLKPKIMIISPPKLNLNYKKIEKTFANFKEEGFFMLENSYDFLSKSLSNMGVTVIDSCVRAGCFDAIHLDEHGHQELAEKIIQEIKEMKI